MCVAGAGQAHLEAAAPAKQTLRRTFREDIHKHTHVNDFVVVVSGGSVCAAYLNQLELRLGAEASLRLISSGDCTCCANNVGAVENLRPPPSGG